MSKLNWKNVMTVACTLVAAIFITVLNQYFLDGSDHPAIGEFGIFFTWVAVAFAVAAIFAEGSVSKWLVFAGLIASIVIAFALTVYGPAYYLSKISDTAETEPLAMIGGLVAFDCVFFISEATFASLNVAKN